MNAVIYARYSSHGQQEQSIDGQLRDCYAFAECQNIQVVGTYIDRAISAKTDDRPEFKRMLSDSAKKQFQYVIVWKLDRFARNRFDSAIHKATLKKNGVKVLSAMENIADNPEGQLLEGILESMAEHYSNSLSTNVKRGQRESVLRGSHLGGVPPFGFKSIKDGDKMRLVADEEKAPIIKYVFEEYAKGKSKNDILGELKARSILTMKGKELTHSCLQHAFRNKKYIGIYMYKGQEIEGACDAIIDEELFNKVQKKLDSRSHGKNAKNVRQEYLLHGKAFCGYCGSPLIGHGGTSKTGVVHHYYACSKRKKYHICNKLNEKKAFLEWYVVEQTVELVLTRCNIDDIATGVVESYDKEFNNRRIRELERKLKKLDAEVDKLIDSLIEMPKKAAVKIGEKIELLETQKADIELNLVTLRIANDHRPNKDEVAKWLKSFCKGDLLDTAYQRRIIDLLLNSVYLYDDRIVIYYNLKGSEKQVSYIDVCDDMEELTPFDVPQQSGSGDKVRGSCSEYSAVPK